MNCFNRIRSRNAILAVVVLCILHGLLSGVTLSQNELGVRIPDNQAADYLELFSQTILANKEEAKTWQGQMTVNDKNHFYDNQFAMVKRWGVDLSDNSSSHIVRQVSAQEQFAYNADQKKCFTSFDNEKHNWYSDVVRQNFKHDYVISSERSIVTPHEYINYRPGHLYGRFDMPVTDGIRSGRAAIIEPPEKASVHYKGRLRHPKDFYEYAGKPVHERLSEIGEVFRDNRQRHNIMGKPMLELYRARKDGREIYRVIRRGILSSDKKIYTSRTIELDSSLRFNPTHIVDSKFTAKRGGGSSSRITHTASFEYEKIGCAFTIPKVTFLAMNKVL